MKTRLVCLWAFLVSALGSSASAVAADLRSASFIGTTNAVPSLTATDLFAPSPLVLGASTTSLLENAKLFQTPALETSQLLLAKQTTFRPITLVDMRPLIESSKRTVTPTADIDPSRFRVVEVPSRPRGIYRLLPARASFPF